MDWMKIVKGKPARLRGHVISYARLKKPDMVQALLKSDFPISPDGTMAVYATRNFFKFKVRIKPPTKMMEEFEKMRKNMVHELKKNNIAYP